MAGWSESLPANPPLRAQGSPDQRNARRARGPAPGTTLPDDGTAHPGRFLHQPELSAAPGKLPVVEVELSLAEPASQQLSVCPRWTPLHQRQAIQLPAWTPSSCLIRDYVTSGWRVCS